MASKFRYLGPSDFISPGAGQPYVAKGEEIELTDEQVDQLLLLGHRFEGEETPVPGQAVPADPRERVAAQERANADTPASKTAAKKAAKEAAPAAPAAP